MPMARVAMAAVAASFFACAASANSTPSRSEPPPETGHGMMMPGMFAQDERMMLFLDMYKATAGMTDGQKKDYRRRQRAHHSYAG